MTDEEVIKKALSRKKKFVIPKRDLLSSGSTLLNLACTGRTSGCFAKGHMYWFVGDSTSGKTWLALSCFAEATINPEFDDYRLIYDNAEDGALMDIERYFGHRVAARLEPPRGSKETPVYSEITEDVHFHIDDAVKYGQPFIYVLDSMDSLETAEDQEKFLKDKAARRGGKESSGSYGMQKAKINSQYVRRLVRECRKTRSIVIIISQTRDSVGYGSQFSPKTAAGGRALKFYATLEIWTSVREKITRKIRNKTRQLGIISKVQVKKSRIMGKDRSVLIPIYTSVGVDDLGACIDYLIDEKHWTGTESTVKAPEFDFNGSKEDLIHKIEEEETESELKALVSEVWNDIERKCEVQRKSRYA